MAKKRKSLVIEYIRAEALSEITSNLVVAFCEHEWLSMGAGFECKKCKYYTGTNNELNNKIKLEIK